MLKKYSPMNMLKHLSRVQMLSVDGQWIMTKMPRKTKEIIDTLEIPIIHN